MNRNARLTTLALGLVAFALAASNGLGWISKDGSTNIPYVVRWEAIYYGTGFLVSLLLCFVYSRIEGRLSAGWLGFWAAVLCFTFGAVWNSVAGLTMFYAGMNQKFRADVGLVVIRGGLMNGTTLGLISFLYFGITRSRQAAEQREKARHATALAHQAQLQMLRYQLNPHFLFNALNSIRGMILEDPRKSREMVGELADFLRYSLNGKGEESPIADEIQAIENYLAIQRIRFEERLDASVEADESALQVPVPCFLIHPLVENAVKYGMKTSPMPLRIRVAVVRHGGEVGIRVSNTGRLMTPDEIARSADGPDGTRVGLTNISERLKLVFPERHSFTMSESGGWVHAEIRFRTAVQIEQHEAAYSADRG